MADRILNIGFIGNGKGTNRYHAPFSIVLPDKFRIKTIYARHAGGPWPAWPGTAYTTDINELLDDPTIDIIEISTPHDTHYELTKIALQAGKHVVCDKAFVGTVAEAEELYALAAEKGVTVQCYQNRRFDSDYLTARKVMESGKLGRVFEIVTHYDYWREVFFKMTHEAPYSKLNGIVYGHSCHCVDQLIDWLSTSTSTMTSWASRPRQPPTTSPPSSARALRSTASAAPSSRWRRTSRSATSRSSTCLRATMTLASTPPSSGASCVTTTMTAPCTRSAWRPCAAPIQASTRHSMRRWPTGHHSS